MIGLWSIRKVPILIGASVMVAVLLTYATVGAHRARLPQNSALPRVARVAPAALAAAEPSATALPSPDPLPAVRPAPSRPVPVAPSARPQEDLGRPNPFVPLVAPHRPSAPVGARRPPASPSRSRPSTFGMDLPLPPGFAAPAGQDSPPPPPGAGMKVGAIMGSRERVAIIENAGKVFVVTVGDRVGDAVVVQILENKVVMRQGDRTFGLPFGGERS